ncbi:glycosyltransferase [Paenibacillus sp. J5C_2022]|uniref:glycosyltransferase n=1 Tax=Paenibacillus sp. J5C2022 TaxID=2977129 RepID=UPI0021D0FE44|nr:glycosyltransferase family 2 protein [Paenibacillus sp. J5C2022]MCU6709997.1 glycosyltransferase [Paenibacillus sp. J5C2022]
MESVLWLIAALLAAQWLFVLWNLSQLPRMAAQAGRLGATLSVLIPARNEEGNIADCLHAAIAAAGDHEVEIIVLDDGSVDRTAELVQEAAASDARVRYAVGSALPPGWTGKCFACHQLAKEANGEWLLFLDADARLSPGAIEAAMAAAVRQGRGLVTGFPFQSTGSWLERLVVPMMVFTVACHLPVRLVRASRDARFIAAHGAFLLAHRDSYAVAGGHEAVRGHLVDDMALAKAMKQAGEPVMLADVREYVSMRMYTKAKEVWSGYKKNIYEGLGRNAYLLLAVVLLYAALYLVPPLALLVQLAAEAFGASSADAHGRLFAALAGWLLGLGIKLTIDSRSGQPIWLALLLPLSIGVVCTLALSSWRGSGKADGYEWKGRSYS